MPALSSQRRAADLHLSSVNSLRAGLHIGIHGKEPEDPPQLAYTNRVITESMRLYAPAWGIACTAIEDHEIAGYPVPQGSGVSFAQWTVHRDERWYDAPEEFRPQRWEGDLLKRLPRFAYFPFGGGPRQCIGNTFALMEAANSRDDSPGVPVPAGARPSGGSSGVDNSAAAARRASQPRKAKITVTLNAQDCDVWLEEPAGAGDGVADGASCGTGRPSASLIFRRSPSRSTGFWK